MPTHAVIAGGTSLRLVEMNPLRANAASVATAAPAIPTRYGASANDGAGIALLMGRNTSNTMMRSQAQGRADRHKKRIPVPTATRTVTPRPIQNDGFWSYA